MDEVWKTVPSCPRIMASSLGRVWVKPSIREMPGGGSREYRSKPTYGYADTSSTKRAGSPDRKILRVASLRRTFKIHQLVCEAFHGPKPFPNAIVLHLDENPANNKPQNIRWGTRKENQRFPKVQEAFRARTGDNSPWAIHQRRSKP